MEKKAKRQTERAVTELLNIRNEIKNVLAGKDGNIVYTDEEYRKNEPIFLYHRFGDTVYQSHVKAVRLNNAELEVLCGELSDYWDKHQCDIIPDSGWDKLYDDEFGHLTAMSIGNAIEAYAENENNVGIDNYQIVSRMPYAQKCELKRQLGEKLRDGGDGILEAVLGIDTLPTDDEGIDEVVSDELLAEEIGITITLKK